MKTRPQTKITKNIPIPSPIRSMYPFAQLQIGDSFTWPKKHKTRLYAALTKYKKATRRQFVSRSISKTTLRIWRTK